MPKRVAPTLRHMYNWPTITSMLIAMEGVKCVDLELQDHTLEPEAGGDSSFVEACNVLRPLFSSVWDKHRGGFVETSEMVVVGGDEGLMHKFDY